MSMGGGERTRAQEVLAERTVWAILCVEVYDVAVGRVWMACYAIVSIIHFMHWVRKS